MNEKLIKKAKKYNVPLEYKEYNTLNLTTANALIDNLNKIKFDNEVDDLEIYGDGVPCEDKIYAVVYKKFSEQQLRERILIEMKEIRRKRNVRRDVVYYLTEEIINLKKLLEEKNNDRN